MVVTITEAGLQTVRQMDGTSEEKLVISFQNASKRLIVNKTQAVALALHLGDEWDRWIGARCPARAGHLAKRQAHDRRAGCYADVGSGAERDAGAAPRPPAATTGAAGSVRPRPGAVEATMIEVALGYKNWQSSKSWRRGRSPRRQRCPGCLRRQRPPVAG